MHELSLCISIKINLKHYLKKIAKECIWYNTLYMKHEFMYNNALLCFLLLYQLNSVRFFKIEV